MFGFRRVRHREGVSEPPGGDVRIGPPDQGQATIAVGVAEVRLQSAVSARPVPLPEMPEDDLCCNPQTADGLLDRRQ